MLCLLRIADVESGARALVGAFGQDVLVDAYRKADLFVMPSSGEGFGRLADYESAAARRVDRPFTCVARPARGNVTQGRIVLALRQTYRLYLAHHSMHNEETVLYGSLQ